MCERGEEVYVSGQADATERRIPWSGSKASSLVDKYRLLKSDLLQIWVSIYKKL